MVQFRAESILPRFIGTRDGRRVPGRVRPDCLYSSLGPVIDLSAGGMRVLARRPCEGELQVTLVDEGAELLLWARIAWTRRLGFRRHEVGVTFLDVDDEVGKVLTAMAADHARKRAV